METTDVFGVEVANSGAKTVALQAYTQRAIGSSFCSDGFSARQLLEPASWMGLTYSLDKNR